MASLLWVQPRSFFDFSETTWGYRLLFNSAGRLTPTIGSKLIISYRSVLWTVALFPTADATFCFSYCVHLVVYGGCKWAGCFNLAAVCCFICCLQQL